MLNKILSKTLVLIIISLIFVTLSFGWDNTGHKVSAYIAWQHMSPEARNKVVELLLSAPEDSHLSVYYAADSRSRSVKELELFMIASTWSDIIRNRDYKVRYEKYNKGPWHYADVFWRRTNGEFEVLDKKSDGLAFAKLYDFEKNLKNDKFKSDEKAVDLAWFLHVAGDVHNPLHNASRVTDIEPEGDRGGNLFLLSPEDAAEGRLNLHSYWDGILRRNVPRPDDACDTEYIPTIAHDITKKFPFEKMDKRLKLGNYKEWNLEGLKLLERNVYPASLKRNELPSSEYQKMAFAIGQEQIALAGYRIGETLNQIFGKK